ncbi:hypothetical protein SLEP1_g55056 [Rubroshorea leprosula]|uniref:Uncharacterized protein n=1 Tax=Rubroshorea leprosula TaxID=152421 RepID=A0AAV5ME96_9ROSI|nr:hypothetical protein SLEP1_g55056 [Rubroshorea leprosula]
MVRTFTGSRPPRNEIDEQEDTQLSEPGLNDFRPMPRNLFVGGAEQDQLSETDDDERTPTGLAEPARTTELKERTRVLEMAMGKILARLILDDPLIPLLNRDSQPTAVVATRNSPALSNVVVPIGPRGKPYQEGFKIPHLETYDGSGDPDEHLHTYQAIMRIQDANDAMMCKVFPKTLKSIARRWEIKHTATELMQVHQKEGESLRDYMQRFNKATLDIDNVPDTICLSTLLHGLKRGRFLDNLLENPPKSWNEVNDRSASFILFEDFQSSKRRADDRQGKEPKQPEGKDNKKKQKVVEQRGKSPSYPKYNNYIPLSLSRSQILAQIQHWVKRPPPQTHDSSRADKSKYCDYHRGYGHNTKDWGQSARGCKAYARQVMTVNKNRPLKRPFEEAEWENALITFSSVDYKRADREPDVMMPHADPFVATKMQLNLSSLQKYEGSIYGFNNQPVPVEGVITLPIYVGSEPRFRMVSVTFLVVKMESAFNAILRRATLYELKAIISQPHLYTFKKVELAAAPTGSSKNHRPTQLGQQTMSISDIEHRPESVEQKAELVKPVETVNQDVFAWTTDEMLGIPAELTVHKLSMDPAKRPVVQKRRLFGPEKQAAIDEEIQKLLQAGFIRRVEYSEWVSNPMLVKKPSGKWRMCINFTNLNEACPKDPHPLPNVEKLVEQAAGHERMSFLDASSSYHQKLVQIIFKLQIGKNIEVYVDDMIVTSVRVEDHIDDLSETFQNLRRAQMKLNPLKCTFAVESGKFLRYVVSKKGIEVNLKKVQAVQQMEPPKTVKDVQRLTGCVAALHRFIARLAERCLSFFKALREPKNFQWTDECQQAFDELKQYLASAPLLSKLVEGETLYLYLGVTEEAVSSVLLREENKNQKPIYYVSKVLQG